MTLGVRGSGDHGMAVVGCGGGLLVIAILGDARGLGACEHGIDGGVRHGIVMVMNDCGARMRSAMAAEAGRLQGGSWTTTSWGQKDEAGGDATGCDRDNSHLRVGLAAD